MRQFTRAGVEFVQALFFGVVGFKIGDDNFAIDIGDVVDIVPDIAVVFPAGLLPRGQIGFVDAHFVAVIGPRIVQGIQLIVYNHAVEGGAVDIGQGLDGGGTGTVAEQVDDGVAFCSAW